MRNKKGFTLIELVVTLAVGAIVLTLVGVFSSMVFTTVKAQNNQTLFIEEFESGKELIQTFESTYSSNLISLNKVDNNSQFSTVVVMDSDNNYYQLSYQKDTKTLKAQILNLSTKTVEEKSLTFTNVADIVFTNNNNFIKCEFFYTQNNFTYNFIFSIG